MDLKSLLLPISSLNRIGPIVGELLAKLVGGNSIFELLLHKPTRVENIVFLPRLFEISQESLVIVKAKIEAHIKPSNNRQPYKVICYTPSGYINLVFFKIFPSQIAKMPIGAEIVVLGKLEKSSGENQITHPQEILPANQIDQLSKINVVYPLSGNLSQKFLRSKIIDSLKKLDGNYEEWIDENLLKQRSWTSFDKALKNLHYFSSEKTNEEIREKSHKRLSYDELLSWQLATLMTKSRIGKTKKFNPQKNNICDDFIISLPFKITDSQKKVIAEISQEINSNKKMLRLLQGDVGSGKTIVAIVACLQSISQGKQSCIIAPTTVLAKQHFAYFNNLLKKFDIKIELITSANTKKQKEKIVENLRNGKIDILIGTHAILEDYVTFQNLGLAVIDEQHRFGVMQRLKLVEKGKDVDVLLMSATPIPRSLMMGLYGDLDISILDEKPKNRQKIETLIMSEKKVENLYEAIKRNILRGEKVYWICPTIEENLNCELAGSQFKFKELSKIFGEKKVALLHGKMKEKEKNSVMENFVKKDSEVKILVATTVIEVGIDVPDATVIIIENAENFGLSQLHQLRGRVGRSEMKSFCILIYGKKFGINGKKRLDILRQSNDGFFIAEEDLKMRGSGELLGTKQSGFPEFKIANLASDTDILKIANQQAKIILNKDENLGKIESEKYRILLKLFNYEDCLRVVGSG